MFARHVSCCLSVLHCLWMGAALAAEPAAWDFASRDGAWQPRAKGVVVERTTTFATELEP